ncbi:DMT family transporter [Streptomyces sp. NPDC008150]|uniref:DMT family transporter n=1 Tax=Streptomyces sp. NPDC008150 TaxID=3364816 RepID=UPI0036E6805E
MSALALSVLLSLVSAVAYAGGAIVQERVAVSGPDGEYAPVRRPIWWVAVGLNGLGALLHVGALAFGPLSLVQPLGALTIVFALPMAALFVGRKAGATAWRGAIMATVGLAGLLSLVGAGDTHSLDLGQRLLVALVTGGAVVALVIAGRAAHRHPAVRSVLLATASGIAFGMASVYTKTVTVGWSGGVTAANLVSMGVIGVLATAGMLLSQASYRGGGLAAPLATLTVVNPVVAAAIGITMFGETFRYGLTGTVLALSAGVVAAGGLILLLSERIEDTDRTAGEAGTAGTFARTGDDEHPALSVGTEASSPRTPEAESDAESDAERTGRDERAAAPDAKAADADVDPDVDVDVARTESVTADAAAAPASDAAAAATDDADDRDDEPRGGPGAGVPAPPRTQGDGRTAPRASPAPGAARRGPGGVPASRRRQHVGA